MAMLERRVDASVLPCFSSPYYQYYSQKLDTDSMGALVHTACVYRLVSIILFFRAFPDVLVLPEPFPSLLFATRANFIAQLDISCLWWSFWNDILSNLLTLHLAGLLIQGYGLSQNEVTCGMAIYICIVICESPFPDYLLHSECCPPPDCLSKVWTRLVWLWISHPNQTCTFRSRFWSTCF